MVAPDYESEDLVLMHERIHLQLLQYIQLIVNIKMTQHL